MAGWAGLVTNASPYAIPEGAATEQTNLTTLIPGQLTSRGGMRRVAFTSSASEIRDCFPYVTSTAVKLLVLNADGSISVMSTPAYDTAPGAPLDPSLTPSSGQVVSNYVGTFYDHAGEPPT